MKRIAAAILVAMCVGSLHLSADCVELLDGTVLTGRVLRGTELQVVMEEIVGDRAQERRIPHGDVHAVTVGDVRIVLHGTGLIGWWRFDDATPAGQVTDSSSLAVSGDLENGAAVGPGYSGGGLVLDGVDDRVRMARCPEHDNLTALTFAAWILPQRDSHWHVIDKDDGDKRIYAEGQHRLLSGHIRYAGQHAHADSAVDTIQLGVWQHVAMTWSTSDNTVRLYWNGTEVSYSKRTTGSGQVLDDTGHSFTLGARGALGPVTFFEGTLDDCRIYNRVLSPQEIRRLAVPPQPN